MKLPKVVIGIPTYNGKSYCEDQFFECVINLNYPKKLLAILVIDNSTDEGKYARTLQEKYPNFKIIHQSSNEVVYKRLFNSHETIRKEFLKTPAKFLLHLESDVLIPKDTIQRLLRARKSVVSPVYNLSLGVNRHIVQRNRQWGMPFGGKYSWGYTYGTAHQSFLDGTVKKVQTSGIGCILVHRSIMKAVPFRYRPDVDAAPDSAFATDLLLKGIDNFCDTSFLVNHANGDDWGSGNTTKLEKYE